MIPLTPEVASRIYMDQCKAMCCRGPIILRLTSSEVPGFKERAAALGVDAQISQAPDGGGWLRFTDHLGERCPMLDSATFACRIYRDRPQRCREFPQKPEPGCAISGWEADGDSGSPAETGLGGASPTS